MHKYLALLMLSPFHVLAFQGTAPVTAPVDASASAAASVPARPVATPSPKAAVVTPPPTEVVATPVIKKSGKAKENSKPKAVDKIEPTADKSGDADKAYLKVLAEAFRRATPQGAVQ